MQQQKYSYFTIAVPDAASIVLLQSEWTSSNLAPYTSGSTGNYTLASPPTTVPTAPTAHRQADLHRHVFSGRNLLGDVLSFVR